MAMLLGKKIGMTRVYDESGNLVPATVMHVGPCVVTQVKTIETDGYNAIQIGYQDTKPSRQTKPLVGHCGKANTVPKQFVREIRLGEKDIPDCQAGDSVTVDVFNDIKHVDVAGTSKGKGFAGPMKRHGFGGFPASHGCERKHRAPGSQASFSSGAGAGGGPKKGKKMGGHMGDVQITTKNHRLLAVDTERNLLIVKGAIAGASGNYCVIKSTK
jgi:large subunit ribosomal protein L3